jgi:hypothetical protein
MYLSHQRGLVQPLEDESCNTGLVVGHFSESDLERLPFFVAMPQIKT